jgi:hypothetical protein
VRRSPTRRPTLVLRGRLPRRSRETIAPRREAGVRGPSAAAESVRRLDARRVVIAALALQQPSLDDVFLMLTGWRVEDERTHESQVQDAA